MGVNLVGIIKHEKSASELIKFPEEIDSWNELRLLRLEGLRKIWKEEYIIEHCCKNEEAKWRDNFNMKEETLKQIWTEWDSEPDYSTGLLLNNQIESFFGTIKVYENTLIIEHSPWYRYSCLKDPDIANSLLSMNRWIAKKLNQNKVVYCVDSSFPTEIIYDFANKGKTIEEIISFATLKMGEIPKALFEGMKFTYFIDDYTDDMNKFEEWEYEDMHWFYDSESSRYKRKNEM